MITTLVSEVKTAYTVSFAILLTSLIMEIMFADPNTVYLFFLENSSTGTKIIRYLFMLIPPFSYSVMFSFVSEWTSYHYSGV